MTQDFMDALQEALDREGYSYVLIAMHNDTGDGEVRFCDANWNVGDDEFRWVCDDIMDDVFLKEWDGDPLDGEEGVDWEWEYYEEEEEEDYEGDEWKYA